MAKGPRTVFPFPDGIAEHWALEEGCRTQFLVNALCAITHGYSSADWIDYLLAELREPP